MGKFYITLISFCGLLFSAHFGWAQCPGEGQFQAQVSSIQSFENEQGEITFNIADQLAFNWANYRIRLWEEDSQRYVYDDNAPPFLNKAELIVNRQAITFTQLPKGKYSLELHGADCHYQRFTVDGLAKVLSN